jgi:hypothetical protein
MEPITIMRYALVGYNTDSNELEVELVLPDDKADSVKLVAGVGEYVTVINQKLSVEQASRALGVLELENMVDAASLFDWFLESLG